MKRAGQQVVAIAAWLVLMSAGLVLGGLGPKVEPVDAAPGNTMICLINQASFLLGRQLQTLERAFVDEGGFTERMYRARQSKRRGS